AGRLDLGEVDPVAADVEVLRVPVDAGHLDRGDVLQTELGRGPVRLLHPGNAVVVGQRHHGYSRLGGGADDVGGRELAVGDGRMRLEIDHVCYSYPSRSTKRTPTDENLSQSRLRGASGDRARRLPRRQADQGDEAGRGAG